MPTATDFKQTAIADTIVGGLTR